MSHWLDRLLSPASIAIVGASEREGSLAASTQQQLVDSGYQGAIYAVNPKYSEIYGQPCYPALNELPQVPDLVVYAISGIPLEQSFEQAMALGVGGVVIYAANHIEEKDEPKLIERLRLKAAAAGIPVIGGNSMGFYNYDDNILVSFDFPPAGRPSGHIGLITHTGSGMTYMANNDLRFCFNYVIASAQETNATIGDYVDYLLEQASTRVIAIVLENVRDVPAFVAALEKARQRSIPVLVTPLGRTEQSAQMAMSHSGAIVGDHEALTALCQRHAAILCRDMDELIVTAMLFGAGCRVESGGLASMLDSGGMREQMIDLGADLDLPFAKISTETTQVLRDHLEPHLEPVNPMDGMGDLGRDVEKLYLECGKALLNDPDSGLLSFEFEFRDGFCHYPGMFDVTRQLAQYNDKPVILINSCSFASLSETAAQLTWEGIPVINGIDVALRAIRNLMGYRPHQAFEPQEPVSFDGSRLAAWNQRLRSDEAFDEIRALELMSEFGLPTVDFDLVEDPAQLIDAAERQGYSVVLKTAMPGIAHKSDQGGVCVGIADQAQLEAAYQDFCTRLGPRALVMPQVRSGIEVSLGMKNDPQFGPLVIVACGGELIELLAERAFRLAPVDSIQANAMIDEIRLARLLAGVRGKAAVNRDALVELIVRFAALAMEFRETIAEIDLNPIIVNPDGCRIVDALIVPRRGE